MNTLRRKVLKPTDFISQVLNRILSTDNGCELVHVCIKENKVSIQFKNVNNKSVLTIKIKIIINCINEWNKMLTACDKLAKITANAVINGYAKEVQC